MFEKNHRIKKTKEWAKWEETKLNMKKTQSISLVYALWIILC